MPQVGWLDLSSVYPLRHKMNSLGVCDAPIPSSQCTTRSSRMLYKPACASFFGVSHEQVRGKKKNSSSGELDFLFLSLSSPQFSSIPGRELYIRSDGKKKIKAATQPEKRAGLQHLFSPLTFSSFPALKNSVGYTSTRRERESKKYRHEREGERYMGKQRLKRAQRSP